MKKNNRNLIYPLLVVGFILIFTCSCENGEDEDNNTETVTDIDGNVYRTVTIGTQVWMAENLKTTKYSNGDPIETTIPAPLDISHQVSPKYQWSYEGNESNVATYGRLYTWYAITDSRNICPSGWHVATNADWGTLINYLIANGYNFDGKKAENNFGKAMAAKTNWAPSTTEGTVGNTDYPTKRNKSGFSGLPGGYRGPYGTFTGLGYSAFWWSCDEYDSDEAGVYGLGNDGRGLGVGTYGKHWGASVRCVKD